MKNKLFEKILLLLIALTLVTTIVHAEENDSEKLRANLKGSINASSTASTTKRQVKLEQGVAGLQERALREIDRRIEMLTKLSTRIQAMKKVSAANKSSLGLTIQGQITLLNNLKIKINADTDLATLKSDVQSITKSYRIFALILPQITILATADRMGTTVDLLDTLAGQIQTRLNTLSDDKDITALQKTLNEMKTKIAAAKLQYQTAINLVTPLTPDNGDKTKMESNMEVLKNARIALRTGMQDLKAAHTIQQRIRQSLKKSNEEKNIHASSTVNNTITQ